MKSFFVILISALTIWITEVNSMSSSESDALIEQESRLLTHQSANGLELSPEEIAAYKLRLQTRSDLILPLDEELAMLDQLLLFDLGRFLLKNRGLNGYWTAYLILNGFHTPLATDLEKWVICQAPVSQATQERFKIFQHHLQARIASNQKMASIPCGLMDDLLRLDYNGTTDVTLIGIDLDPESLRLAHSNAKSLASNVCATFLERNALDLGVESQYHTITSNGLNIYEPDDAKVIRLYQNFFEALVPGGMLITSFLTPPFLPNGEVIWTNCDPEKLRKQKALFIDILQARWQTFRTESQTLAQLQSAGFGNCTFIYDSQKMFPTVIAVKPLIAPYKEQDSI